MAENQPAPAPAADPVAPQTPGQQPDVKPADNNPAATPTPAPQAPAITLSDEQKSYLKGQGIAEDQLTSPEAITKLINHAQSSQKTAAERQAELDKIRQTVNPQTQPNNPFGVPGTAQPGQPQPTVTSETPATQDGGIDELTAFTLSSQLATSFPELKDDLTSGTFYKDMQELGTPLTVGGKVNLQGMLKYAAIAQKNRQLEAQVAEANKPGQIPDAKPNDTPTVAEDAPMTKQIAQAILFQDPNHPRAQEARQFLHGKK